jgi:hypothetical protein
MVTVRDPAEGSRFHEHEGDHVTNRGSVETGPAQDGHIPSAETAGGTVMPEIMPYTTSQRTDLPEPALLDLADETAAVADQLRNAKRKREPVNEDVELAADSLLALVEGLTSGLLLDHLSVPRALSILDHHLTSVANRVL